MKAKKRSKLADYAVQLTDLMPRQTVKGGHAKTVFGATLPAAATSDSHTRSNIRADQHNVRPRKSTG